MNNCRLIVLSYEKVKSAALLPSMLPAEVTEGLDLSLSLSDQLNALIAVVSFETSKSCFGKSN